MNFLGHSLIDVSGGTVVCSPFFFRNNGSCRRRRNGASVNSRQVVERPIYNEISTAPRLSQSRARQKKRSIEILAVPKINYGMSARRWRRKRRRRWLGDYFSGNSSRGCLARNLKLGRRKSGYSSYQPTPSTSFASNFSNTRDTLWAFAYRAMFRRDAI